MKVEMSCPRCGGRGIIFVWDITYFEVSGKWRSLEVKCHGVHGVLSANDKYHLGCGDIHEGGRCNV